MLDDELPSTTKILTLESVKSQFSQWRGIRPKGVRVPTALWNSVKELTRSYSYQQISAELKISPSRLHKKCGTLLSPCTLSDQFIQVPISPLCGSATQPPMPEQKYSADAGTIELTRKDGVFLKISGLEDTSLLAVVQAFLKP